MLSQLKNFFWKLKQYYTFLSYNKLDAFCFSENNIIFVISSVFTHYLDVLILLGFLILSFKSWYIFSWYILSTYHSVKQIYYSWYLSQLNPCKVGFTELYSLITAIIEHLFNCPRELAVSIQRSANKKSLNWTISCDSRERNM